jgi:undecaprenyl-diphosphatase
MNSFDYNILVYLNHFGSHSPILTKVIVGIYQDSLKLGLFVALIWWAWFDESHRAHFQEAREKIVASLIGGMLCVGLVRIMVLVLPFRQRPMSTPSLGLTFPIAAEGWGNWSSFPSDHAALFSLLTVCLFSISRRLGLVALVDTVFLICLPRIFVGVHYPTDLIAGALMGIAAGYWLTREQVRSFLSRPMLQWLHVHPASFYASAFLFSFLLAHVFFPVTNIIIDTKLLAHALMR